MSIVSPIAMQAAKPMKKPVQNMPYSAYSNMVHCGGNIAALRE